MALSTILSLLLSNPGWDLVKSLTSYYGLRDYLSAWYMQKFDPDNLIKISAYRIDSRITGDEYFWRNIFSGSILPGDRIELSNFQISPWFPRKPGLYWTYDAAKARKLAWEKHVEEIRKDMIIFDVDGKSLMSELGGIGTVNFRKNRNDVLLTATVAGETQRGIPLIVPQTIWQQISSEMQKGKKLETDLIGTVEEIPIEYDTQMLRSPGIPKVAIKIRSILNIKLEDSREIIKITPWTIFELSDHNYPYGFTFINHDLYGDNMDDSVHWMLDYIAKRNGQTILTDFDENLNHLNAKFPLEQCVSGEITKNSIHGYCQQIYHKYKS